MASRTQSPTSSSSSSSFSSAAAGGRRRRLRCRAAAGGFGKKKTKNKAGSENASDACPCGGGPDRLFYSACCKPYHNGEKQAGDPQTLLRTRFSAYAKAKAQYIIDTTHDENRLLKEGGKVEKTGKVVSSLARDVAATCEKVHFYGLDIGESAAGETDDVHVIEFRFKCRTKGQAGYRMSEEEEHHETSVFERVEDGRWLFRDTLQRKQER